MARSVEAAFQEFLDDLRTSRRETETAASHRASIKAKLMEEFGMTSFFRTGSFGNGTNVSGYSDVDYFAVIPTGELKQDSGFTLARVAEALRARFRTTENIRVDSPGVRVPFGLDGAEATEIVPVDETGRTLLGFRKFDMPDGNGGWKFSAPDSHNAYVSDINDQHDGKVKPLIRFIKAWKYLRGAPISSFYLEIFTAKYAKSQETIIYDFDVALVLDKLFSSGLCEMADPRFPHDEFTLKACKTDRLREEALGKLERAVAWAQDAVALREQPEKALEKWDLVYNYTFPPFG